MPKRNPPKPKPDPLAKVSAPNLRRMVKRLRARVNQLEAMLATSAGIIQHGRGDRQGLAARLREIDNEVREVYGSLQRAHIDRDRLAAELAALKRTPLDAVDVTMAGDEGRRFAGGLPDGRVVCHVAVVTEPHYWHRIVREGGEDTRTIIIPDNTPAEVQVPPFGADTPPTSLPIADCFPWWYVFTPDVRLKPTTYLVATSSPSPWPGVMWLNDIDTDGEGGTVFRVPDKASDVMMLARPCRNPKWELLSFFPLAHTGTVKIGGGE